MILREVREKRDPNCTKEIFTKQYVPNQTLASLRSSLFKNSTIYFGTGVIIVKL